MKKAEVYSAIKSCIDYEIKAMCQNKMKRNHTHDFSSFYSDTFPLILVFHAAFYWRIYLCFLHFNSFAATDLLTLSLFIVVTFRWYYRRWIDTDTIDRYYLSCWLPMVSIHRLKIFHFRLIVSIYFFDRIETSTQDFFSSKDIRSNRCFFTVNRLSVSIQSMFFSPLVPTYVQGLFNLGVSNASYILSCCVY
jgi:hypothetical protein